MKHRLATTSDLPAVASLYHAVWHETHASFMPAEEIARRTLPFFAARMTALLPGTLVAESGGAIAGFASWSGHLLGQIYIAAPSRFRHRGGADGGLRTGDGERGRCRGRTPLRCRQPSRAPFL
jgi:hypothetical protein